MEKSIRRASADLSIFPAFSRLTLPCGREPSSSSIGLGPIHALVFPRTSTYLRTSFAIIMCNLLYMKTPMKEPVKISAQNHHSIQTPGDLFAALAPFMSILGTGILVLLLLLIFGDRISQLFFSAPMVDFDDLAISNGYHEIKSPSGQIWKLDYEQAHPVEFSGVIRHISIDHEKVFPILSHDLLITQGDFADRELVSTRVNNHHFTWRSLKSDAPEGSIHLLHIVPMNQEIYTQLLDIRDWDEVTLIGWEIQKIEAFSVNFEFLGTWMDSGCNTILVTEVHVK